MNIIPIFSFPTYLLLYSLIPISTSSSNPKTPNLRTQNPNNTNNKTPMRGVWLPTSGTEVPYTVEGIKSVIQKCKDIGVNSIFFSVWGQSMTNFHPSTQFTAKYPFIRMNPKFTIDSLDILIRMGGAENIYIYAWFEYGFATTYDNSTGGPIIMAKPTWGGRDSQGNLLTKNKFQWMNSLDPEVQEFMVDLMVDVVENYGVVGIQGDDRFPAMPSEGGYDAYTVAQYKEEHNGDSPPEDYSDGDWIDWRCNILNVYMGLVYNTFNNKGIRVTMAPSVYPWSKEQYLQDWPNWINNNNVDYIIPQVYRYTISSYKSTVSSNYAQILSSLNKQKFCVGVLVGIGGDTTKNVGILEESLEYNREEGINGEIIFYYESLVGDQVANIIKEYYEG